MCDTPQTLIEAVRYFADADVCDDYMRSLRCHGVNPKCPECESDRIGEVKTRRLLRCKDCRRQFSHKVGTIFEDSPLGLGKWFVAVWAIANCKNGISSHELARALGVQQKTAWFMLHRIRKAMEIEAWDKFDGPAEADTTYIGGRAANMHKARREKAIRGRGTAGKTPVHGVLQRGADGKPSQVHALVAKKPKGWGAFDALARKVASVQKEQVDAKIAQEKAARIKKRKSKPRPPNSPPGQECER